jgi:hypothetical protein
MKACAKISLRLRYAARCRVRSDHVSGGVTLSCAENWRVLIASARDFLQYGARIVPSESLTQSLEVSWIIASKGLLSDPTTAA